MKNHFILAFFCAFLLMSCSNQSTLQIYTLKNAISKDILTGFEAETGIKVRQTNFDTNEAMITRLQANRRRYDLVITGNNALENVISGGLAKRIDHSKLTNYRNINPVFQKLFYEPSNEYTIPYGANVFAIVYNPNISAISIRSYLDLWHPALLVQVGIVDDHRIVNGTALRIIGESFNTNNPQSIRTAGELLRLLAPNIRLVSNDRLAEELVSGRVSAALIDSSQIITATRERPELQVVFPLEGVGYNVMASFIPSNAPNPDTAYAFLNYILGKAHRESLTFPEGFGPDSMEAIQEVNAEAEILHNNIWSELRSIINP